MLPKKYRFSARLGEDFFSSSKRIYSPLFVLYWQERNDNHVSASIIIPKKRIPKATDRSKLKRQITAAVLPHLEKQKNISLVVYLKQKVDDKSFFEIKSQVSGLFRRLSGKFSQDAGGETGRAIR